MNLGPPEILSSPVYWAVLHLILAYIATVSLAIMVGALAARIAGLVAGLILGLLFALSCLDKIVRIFEMTGKES